MLLALLTPLRRLVLARVLELVALLLCLVHRLGVVLAGRVDGDELERHVARVDKLVLRAGGNDDDVARIDGLVLACYCGFGFAGCEEEDLCGWGCGG